LADEQFIVLGLNSETRLEFASKRTFRSGFTV